MRLAFAGPSGSGKTTLAAYVSSRYGLERCPVGSRSVAKSMGHASPYDVDAAGERHRFQRRLLAEKAEWEAAHEHFVTDRTAMDNVAYAALHAINAIDDGYLARAVESMARYDHVMYCPASVFLQTGDDPSRRHVRAYHEIFDALLSSLLDRHAPRLVVMWDAGLDARKRAIDRLF